VSSASLKATSKSKERETTMRIEQSSVHDRASRWLGVRTRLAANAVVILLVTAGAASAQSVDFAGATFNNKGLVGVARVPSNATDEFGETLGGVRFGHGDGPE
jgi:hypothetical protein